MTAPEGVRGDLKLLHRGRVLADPRALTVELVSRGRKDIPSDAYNDGEPLKLNIGAPIVEILQVASEPATLPVPAVAADGTAVHIGPSLIGKRHTITITVLTDGGQPTLTCQSPLIDVQVRQQRSDETRPPVVAMVVVIASLALAGVSTLVGVGAAGLAGATLALTLPFALALTKSGRKDKQRKAPDGVS
jgi:hypothetical protein